MLLHFAFIELEQFGQSGSLLDMRVWTLEEFVDVVKNEEVLEDTDEVRRLVIHQVVHRLHLLVVRVQVFIGLLQHGSRERLSVPGLDELTLRS